MSDLEGEQERAAGLSAALDDTRQRLSAAESAKEVAEARLARAQKQVAAANQAAAELEAKGEALASQLKVMNTVLVGQGARENNLAFTAVPSRSMHILADRMLTTHAICAPKCFPSNPRSVRSR